MPLVPGTFFYGLPLDAMSFEGQSNLPLPASAYQNHGMGGAILDSGTNILLLPENVFAALQTAFQSVCTGATCMAKKQLKHKSVTCLLCRYDWKFSVEWFLSQRYQCSNICFSHH